MIIHEHAVGHIYEVLQLVVACQLLLGVKRRAAQRAERTAALHVCKAV
jgi:hypothetical protein